ncbi:MAG: hypothetical protein KC478_12350 [Bacteriovoracaceae bacterium]|nr:hypothetical protein [Bacteriovoracaceae bacterium]
MQDAIVRDAAARIKHINTYKSHFEANPSNKLLRLEPQYKSMKTVKLFDKEERKAYELYFRRGKIFEDSGRELDTHGLANGAIHYVVDKKGRFFHLRKTKQARLHLFGLVKGEDVICAGTMVVKHGYLKQISDFSNEYIAINYSPLSSVIQLLKDSGIWRKNIKVKYRKDSFNKLRQFE